MSRRLVRPVKGPAMRPPAWQPPIPLSPTEAAVVRRVRRAKLFVFLRQHRHDLFDDAFQTELAALYKDSPLGQPPVPPAQLALATLLQAYVGCADDEAVEAGADPVAGSSLKATLDLDWDDPAAVAAGLGRVLAALDAVEAWLARQSEPPAAAVTALAVAQEVRAQDVVVAAAEPARLRQGV